MTSSETPTEAAPTPAAEAAEPEPVVEAKPEAAEPEPVVEAKPEPKPAPRGVQLAPWMLAAAVVPPGWFYILRIARWHVTASTVLLMLCWIAIVATGYWAIRMALAASAEGDEGWFTVRGRRDELEREKRSLLKAIKDIEFDHETGKLTAADAAALTASYRARAIEVIKAIEAEAGAGATLPDDNRAGGSLRERILAEARARRAVDAKVKAKSKGNSKGKKEKAA